MTGWQTLPGMWKCKSGSCKRLEAASFALIASGLEAERTLANRRIVLL